MSMLSYQYQPLQYDDSIRVLVLHPSLNDSDPILCTLQSARLSDASLEYTALSYTWGDNAQQQAISLHHGTRKLPVRRNCHDALQRLRNGTRDRLLWIDAICINQTDLSERARQVRIMDRIFDCASNVTVFLGEETEGSRILFEELTAVDYGHRPHLSPISDIIVQELKSLFDRSWFERVWVLQEVCAKGSLTIMCGSASVSSDALSSVYRRFFGYRKYRGGTKINRPPLALEWIARPPTEYSTPQSNLWNRLFESRKCLATDPRDKIFALKSLIGSKQSEIDPLISYKQTLEQCFTKVALFLLPVIGLRILTAVRHPHKMDMPSWIPDWSQNLPLHPFYAVDEDLDEAANAFGLVLKQSNERMHRICTISDGEDGDRLELQVTGFQYARIVDRSLTFSFDNIDDAEIQMKALYYSLDNLRELISKDMQEMQENHVVCDRIGHKILDGKHTH